MTCDQETELSSETAYSSGLDIYKVKTENKVAMFFLF